jgi:hypothetical protein
VELYLGDTQLGRTLRWNDRLTTDERARITEIQDLLIERYVEQREALEEGKKARAIEIGFEIKELRRDMETVKGSAKV